MTTEYCFDLENTPENALAQKIKNDIFDKLLECSTKEEVKDVINSVVASNYSSLDIEKIRINSIPISTALDSFVACSLEETTENLPSSIQVQVGDLLKNAIDLVCNPPSFNIPYPYPIIDISANFFAELLLSLLKLVIKVLLSILKKILNLILDICSSGLSFNNFFGGQNIGDMLVESLGNSIEEATSYVNDVFAVFNIDAQGIPSTNGTNNCDEAATIDTAAIKSTSQFLDDLSLILTPVEICNLFESNPTEQALQSVEELMSFEYPNMAVVFNNRTKIKELFKLLGKKVDPKICELIKDNADKITSNPDICFTEDGNELRRNLLGTKNLSDEEIEQILVKERERQKDNLEKINQIVAAIKTNPDNLFGDQQDIFCKNGKPGIISMDSMPSLVDSATNTIDYIYNIFSTTAIKELDAFGGRFLTQEKILDQEEPVIPKFTALSIVDKDGNTKTFANAINPTFIQKTSFGSFTLCDNTGDSVEGAITSFYKDQAQDDEGNVDINKVISATSKKDVLANFGGADNVYIANYIGKQKICNDLYKLSENIDNFGLLSGISETEKELIVAASDFPGLSLNKKFKSLVSYDTNELSISINIPVKFSPFGEQQTIPDFSTIESNENIIIYVTGTI